MMWWIETDDAGVVRRWSSSPMPAPWVAADHDQLPADHYLHEGRLHPVPASPGPWAVFDAAAGIWTDPRDPGAIAADQAAALLSHRQTALADVNRTIGEVRSAYITTIPGQEMIYLAKEAEARAWLADPAPDPADYPLLVAEIGITAPDAAQLAQLWLNMAALWRGVAATLEALRLGTAAALSAAPDSATITATLNAFHAAIAALET